MNSDNIIHHLPMKFIEWWTENVGALEIGKDYIDVNTGMKSHLSPIATLQQANAEKLEKAKEMLGSNWILHKDNAVTRKELDK